MLTPAPQVQTLGRESLKPETHSSNSLGPQKDRWDWSWALVLVLGVTGFFLCFAEEIGMGLGSLQLPQTGQRFNKDLFHPPSMLLLYLCSPAGSQIPLRSVTHLHVSTPRGLGRMVSNLLVSLGHTGRRKIVLIHTLNTQTLTKTDEQKKKKCFK